MTRRTVGWRSEMAEDDARALSAWLLENAVPVRGVRAGGGFADLRPLKRILHGVRIVGLGEATHGTREFFLFKHRLLEFLVREMGFTVFAIESGREACLPIDRYVRHGEGDAAGALAGQGYWTWDTEEVLAMIRWMREHNRTVPEERKVGFFGLDARDTDRAETGSSRPESGAAGRDLGMARTARRILDEGPSGARMVLWAHNGHVSKGELYGGVPAMGKHLRRDFGNAYYALGFAFDRGKFQALPLGLGGGRPVERAVGPAKKGSVEWCLASVDLGDYLLDLRADPTSLPPEAQRWLCERRPMRSVGSVAPRWLNRFSYAPTAPAEHYDGLAFFERTTRARPVRSTS